MQGARYAEPLKIEALRELSWYGCSGDGVARPFGISTPLLYACIRLQSEQHTLLAEIDALRSEVRELEHALQQTSEERDMLRNGHRLLSVTMGARGRTPGFETRRAARARRDAGMDQG